MELVGWRWSSGRLRSVAQQEINSHTHAAPRRRQTEDTPYQSRRAGRSSEPSISDDIVIRSRDHPTSLSWFSMCLERVYYCEYCSYHCQLCLISSPSPSCLALLIFGRRRDRGLYAWPSYHFACIAIPASCGAPRRANLFFPLAREVKEMRRASTTHAYTAHRKPPGGLILLCITALS